MLWSILLSIWVGGYLSVTAHLLKEDLKEGAGLPAWYEWFIPLLWPLNVIDTIIEIYLFWEERKKKH